MRRISTHFTFLTLGILILSWVFRIDQEVALVSMYSLLHAPKELLIDWCHCLFTDTPVSVQRCESRISFLPLLSTGYRAVSLMGSSR